MDIIKLNIDIFYQQVPLTFDRASETKVGVFYTRLKTLRYKNNPICQFSNYQATWEVS